MDHTMRHRLCLSISVSGQLLPHNLLVAGDFLYHQPTSACELCFYTRTHADLVLF
jgi:hypothetical protein